MHPVANQVEIPTEKISEALERCAVPGFSGSITGHIRLLPTAGLEVEFRFEKLVTLQVNKPTEPERPIVTNERVAKVRRMVQEASSMLVVSAPVTLVYASFDNGDLRTFRVGEVEEKCPSRT